MRKRKDLFEKNIDSLIKKIDKISAEICFLEINNELDREEIIQKYDQLLNIRELIHNLEAEFVPKSKRYLKLK